MWPLRPDGSLEPRIAIQSERSANWLELRATFSSAADASTSLALAKMLSGVQFGGHWKDEPPCFAIVADEGDRAKLPSVVPPSPLQQVPEWTVQPLPQDVMGDVVTVVPRLGPASAMELWCCVSRQGKQGGLLEVREWPSLRTLYLTTARQGRPDDELAREPWAGQVLQCRVDVPGLPVNFARLQA